MSVPPALKAGGEKSAGLVARIQRFVDWLALAGAYIAAACLVAMVLLVLTEIAMALLSRVFPSLPTGLKFAWEYSAYLMGSAFMFGGALTLRSGMQIRVELLLRAGNGRFQRPLELLAATVGASFLCMLAWSLTRFTWQSWTSSQVSGDTLTPLWIPQGSLTLATWIFALQAVARVLLCLTGQDLENEEFKVASATE
jgi:TRAP-type mannitol/chloroaromatic compound transport system permease small subunit